MAWGNLTTSRGQLVLRPYWAPAVVKEVDSSRVALIALLEYWNHECHFPLSRKCWRSETSVEKSRETFCNSLCAEPKQVWRDVVNPRSFPFLEVGKNVKNFFRRCVQYVEWAVVLRKGQFVCKGGSTIWQNRPFAQLLSGLETGHPAAAGRPSPACDFSVSDEQKAVFLVSVLDCSECDSSGLDHLNSSWSIARLREYFRRKIGHSWTARKPSFLNGKRPYIVTSHSTHRVSPVSLWQVRLFEFGFGFLKLNLEHRLSERVLEKKMRTQSTAVQESRAFWTPSISQSSPGIHTALRVHPRCSSKCNLKEKPPGTNFACVATSSPWFLPGSKSEWRHQIWPKLPKTTAGANITLSLNASTCFVLSLGRQAGEKKTPMAPHLLSGSVWPFSVSKNWSVEESTGS